MKKLLFIVLVLAYAAPAWAIDIPVGSTAYPLLFFMYADDGSGAGVTGLSPTVTISKNGGSYNSPAGAVSQVANGLYKVAGNATDTDTKGVIWLKATGTGALPFNYPVATIVFDSKLEQLMSQAVTTSLATAVANNSVIGYILAASAASDYDRATDSLHASYVNAPTVTDVVNGVMAEATTVRANQSFANYPIWMLSNSGAGVTGITTSQISCQESIDAGSWTGLTDTTETEIGLGKYVVDLTSGETNGSSISIICIGPAGTVPYRTNITPQH